MSEKQPSYTWCCFFKPHDVWVFWSKLGWFILRIIQKGWFIGLLITKKSINYIIWRKHMPIHVLFNWPGKEESTLHLRRPHWGNFHQRWARVSVEVRNCWCREMSKRSRRECHILRNFYARLIRVNNGCGCVYKRSILQQSMSFVKYLSICLTNIIPHFELAMLPYAPKQTNNTRSKIRRKAL